jgi:peroxiredoxin
MKKQVVSMIAGLFLVSGWALAQSFTIDGKIDGVKGGQAELQLRENGKNVSKFSSGIADDGSFTLKGTITEPDLYLLKIGDLRGGIYIFLDNSKMTVTGKSDDLPGVTITGSALQDAFMGFDQLNRQQTAKLRDLYKAAMEADQAKKSDEVKKLQDQIDQTTERQMAQKLDYIQTIVKTPVAPFLLASLMNNIEDIETVEKIEKSFDPKLSNYKYTKMLDEALASKKVTAIGQKAPDFTQNDPLGKPVKLSDFRGKYVLVDFWASWCNPCRAENPNVVAAYQKYKDKGFTILGVSLDRNKENWIKAITDDHLVWSQVSDLKYWNNEVAVKYGIRSIPANILLDRKGVIIGKNLRGPALDAMLENVLK